MNKPKWNDAPDWARWLAMDSNGQWFWYELAPFWRGAWDTNGKYKCATLVVPIAENTLEQRLNEHS